MHHNRKLCACNNIFTGSNVLSFVNTFVFYIPLQLNLVRKSLCKKTSMYLCISSAHLWKVKALDNMAILIQNVNKRKRYMGRILAFLSNSRLLWNWKFFTSSGQRPIWKKSSLQRYSDGQDPSFCSKFLVVFFEVNWFLNNYIHFLCKQVTKLIWYSEPNTVTWCAEFTKWTQGKV